MQSRRTLHRILVVDDDYAVRGLLGIAFERAGIETDVAEDGRQAVDLLQSRAGDYCTVVLDLHMPPPDGIEVSRIIVRNFPSLPVIVVSGRPDLSSHICGGLEFGASVKLVISKPVDAGTVAEIVHTHCLRSRPVAE